MKFLQFPGITSLVFLVLFLLVVPHGAVALQSFSGDQVSIDTPVADDVFATGGMITVNAPVDSLIAAGGTITLNAPVKGDVIVAGGRVLANNNIGGKLVAAGGSVDVNGDVGTNALLAGGTVTLNPRSTIGRDAEISAGNVASSGNVMGNLSVRSQNFADTGNVGGKSTYVRTGHPSFSTIFTILGFLVSLGMLVLGLVLLKIAPVRYRAVEVEVTKSPVVKLVVGFVGLIVAFIVLVILAISIVGLPVAVVSGLLILIGIIVSVLFVSSALGRWLLGLLNVEIRDWYAFIAGFVLLSILFRIPIAGIIILIISISLGFGALLYSVYNNWKLITGNAVDGQV
jgi:hypothetical protein